MQYLLIICDREEDQPQPGTERMLEMMRGYFALEEELRREGKLLVGGGRLMGGAEARSVRVRKGKAIVTDGPFAETREVMGGYIVVECESLEEALGYAARIPTASWGTVEVRPFLRSGYARPVPG